MGIQNIEAFIEDEPKPDVPCDPRVCCHNPECPSAGKCGGECARRF